MLCFKDTTFCSASEQCANAECSRRFTHDLQQKGIAWWGDDDFPVAWSDFKQDCGKFVANDSKI